MEVEADRDGNCTPGGGIMYTDIQPIKPLKNYKHYGGRLIQGEMANFPCQDKAEEASELEELARPASRS